MLTLRLQFPAIGSFSVVLDREWPGCPAIWVGRSQDQKNIMQENVGLIC